MTRTNIGQKVNRKNPSGKCESCGEHTDKLYEVDTTNYVLNGQLWCLPCAIKYNFGVKV